MNKIKLALIEIIIFHDILCDIGSDKANKGVLSSSAILFALDKIKCDKSEDIYDGIAILVRNIGNQHPFVDGNKRTALFICETILLKNSLFLDLSKEEKKKFILDVAKGEYNNLIRLSTFIKTNSKSLENYKK